MVRTREQHDFVAVVVTADGRRLTVPLSQVVPAMPVRDVLRLLVLGLVGLITGSRRESGGRR